MSGETRRVDIRRLTSADRETALEVINVAARWYRDFLPPEDYHEPEMTAEDWDVEARRLTWYGAFEGLAGELVGVMDSSASATWHSCVTLTSFPGTSGRESARSFSLTWKESSLPAPGSSSAPTVRTPRLEVLSKRRAMGLLSIPKRCSGRTTPFPRTV